MRVFETQLDNSRAAVATIRAAIEALRQSGISLGDLEGDLEIVTQKLIDLQPELEKKFRLELTHSSFLSLVLRLNATCPEG